MIVFLFIIGLVFNLVGGVICSSIAEHKGYDETVFFWVGFFFFIPTVIILCVMQNKRNGFY